MEKRNLLLNAAVAGLMGAAVVAAPAMAAKDGKMKKGDAEKNVKCYGVNKCSGLGKCGQAGHECAGKNTCKGAGWLMMPKDSCLAIEGGSLTPKAEEKK
ncbi:MAG TPA: DUF2282 domain-containing protein [Elusimicrobiota bacterium]|jgi:uncharacterized membrane protein|nr:DUF2282 domain-containing protein [Elusimicrobiota bacterium]